MATTKLGTYNQSYVDVWTPIHGATGYLLGLGGVSPVGYFALSLTFEIFEQTLEKQAAKGVETAANVLGDMAVGLAMYVWGRSHRTWDAPPAISADLLK